MTTTSPLRILIAGAIVSAVTSGFCAAAVASDSTDAPHVVVQYGDLNQSNAQGAAMLYRRIRSAAETVCPGLEHASLASKRIEDACIQKAIADAVIKVNQPALFVVYNAKNTAPLPVMAAAGQIR